MHSPPPALLAGARNYHKRSMTPDAGPGGRAIDGLMGPASLVAVEHNDVKEGRPLAIHSGTGSGR